jgi:hypothetical protein
MLLRSATDTGIALVRTVYCVSPILARPETEKVPELGELFVLNV